MHHLDNSRSLRILWLLDELGFPYGMVEHQRDKVTRPAPASLEAIQMLPVMLMRCVDESTASLRVISASSKHRRQGRTFVFGDASTGADIQLGFVAR